MSANYQRRSELYLRIYKIGTGKRTVTYPEAVEVALCWGWIDGVRNAFDEHSFLQRFTPRRPKSVWSQINRDRVERLIAAGRMTPHGLAAVAAAKSDGRWQAAYASGAHMTVPDELVTALRREPRAWATFQSLNKQNRYALAYRLAMIKTAAGREKRIRAFVEMLKKGQAIYPSRPKPV